MATYNSTRSCPYVYICTHKTSNEFYIGYREKNVKYNLPSDQDLPKYKTSSKKVRARFDEYSWKILAEFTAGDDAYDFEQQLISENWNNPLLLNGYYRLTNGKKRFKNNKERVAWNKGLTKNDPRVASAILAMSRARTGAPRIDMMGNIPWNTGVKCPQLGVHLKGKISPKKGKKYGPNPTISAATKGILKGPQTKITCPHCSKVGGNAMKRWHFDNCKDQ